MFLAYRAPGTVRTARSTRSRSGVTHRVTGESFDRMPVVHLVCGIDLLKDRALVENRVADEVSCLRCQKAQSK